MGASKEIFLKKKDLAEKWRAVVHSDYFAEVLAFTRGELLDITSMDAAQLIGARNYQNVLLTIADEEPPESDLKGPGLIHDLDPKPRNPKDKEQPPKK